MQAIFGSFLKKKQNRRAYQNTTILNVTLTGKPVGQKEGRRGG